MQQNEWFALYVFSERSKLLMQEASAARAVKAARDERTRVRLRAPRRLAARFLAKLARRIDPEPAENAFA